MGNGIIKPGKPKTIPKEIEKSSERMLEEYGEKGQVKDTMALLDKSPELISASLNDDGMRILHIAAASAHEELVRALLTRGALLDEKNNEGATALMFAAAGGHEQICKIILDAGADVRIEDASSKNALSYAQLHNQTKTENLTNVRLVNILGEDLLDVSNFEISILRFV